MSSRTPAEPASLPGAKLAAGPRDAAYTPGAAGGTQQSVMGTTLCTNCGAQLTGKYCSECGQRHHDHPVHDLGHFINEATEDLTHADSRLWRTLIALLFRPGFLTRQFLEGRRMSYLPPVRLYLVLSVLFFLIAAVAPAPGTTGPIAVRQGSEIVVTPFGVGTVDATRATQICASFNYTGPWAARLAPRIRANCAKVLTGNGENLRNNFLHNAGRALFILLPLVALVMKTFYLKPARHYVEHLLFLVHNHSFLFVVLGIYAVLTGHGPAWVRTMLHPALWIYILVYFYASMRQVYRQGRLLTAAKLGALFCAYFLLGTFLAVVTAAYSFLTL